MIHGDALVHLLYNLHIIRDLIVHDLRHRNRDAPHRQVGD